MKTDLLTKVDVEGDSFFVLIKAKYLIFLSMPRTSVMPSKATKFVSSPGFQVRYNTSNREIMEEWHEMIVSLIRSGRFKALTECTRYGFFPYPDEKKYLRQYVKRFF
jgi:hypothetical protein